MNECMHVTAIVSWFMHVCLSPGVKCISAQYQLTQIFFLYIFHNGHRFFWNYKFRKHIRLQMKVSIAFILLLIYLPAFFFILYFFSKTFYSHAVQQWPCVPLSQFYKLVSEDTNFIDSDKPITNANITWISTNVEMIIPRIN